MNTAHLPTDLRPGTRTVCEENHRGALRLGSKVVWECGHVHRRRDQSSRYGPSAAACAHEALRLLAVGNPRLQYLSLSRYAVRPVVRLREDRDMNATAARSR
jgi:hypothetical protein